MKPELGLVYDRESDVLYISMGPKMAARSEEEEPGAVWRYDPQTGRLVGVTLLDFSAYWRERLPKIAELIAHRFHVPTAKTHELLRKVA